ncbi:hypothetical protein HanXRQr2_Chr13g0567921 [Helianthus annuus]|uniref:Uncharacterized protein n=1 Tax=Helianthus annuus TaxID=4232 RepID=A0A9K3EG53_HELAN|nr:hypothetical protein HanXRQr2_Chr13g0567921 [Helianthus annuus]
MKKNPLAMDVSTTSYLIFLHSIINLKKCILVSYYIPVIPALLIKASIRPKASQALRTDASMDGWTVGTDIQLHSHRQYTTWVSVTIGDSKTINFITQSLEAVDSTGCSNDLTTRLGQVDTQFPTDARRCACNHHDLVFEVLP